MASLGKPAEVYKRVWDALRHAEYAEGCTPEEQLMAVCRMLGLEPLSNGGGREITIEKGPRDGAHRIQA